MGLELRRYVEKERTEEDKQQLCAVCSTLAPCSQRCPSFGGEKGWERSRRREPVEVKVSRPPIPHAPDTQAGLRWVCMAEES